MSRFYLQGAVKEGVPADGYFVLDTKLNRVEQKSKNWVRFHITQNEFINAKFDTLGRIYKIPDPKEKELSGAEKLKQMAIGKIESGYVFEGRDIARVIGNVLDELNPCHYIMPAGHHGSKYVGKLDSFVQHPQLGKISWSPSPEEVEVHFFSGYTTGVCYNNILLSFGLRYKRVSVELLGQSIEDDNDTGFLPMCDIDDTLVVLETLEKVQKFKELGYIPPKQTDLLSVLTAFLRYYFKTKNIKVVNVKEKQGDYHDTQILVCIAIK